MYWTILQVPSARLSIATKVCVANKRYTYQFLAVCRENFFWQGMLAWPCLVPECLRTCILVVFSAEHNLGWSTEWPGVRAQMLKCLDCFREYSYLQLGSGGCGLVPSLPSPVTSCACGTKHVLPAGMWCFLSCEHSSRLIYVWFFLLLFLKDLLISFHC